MILNVNNQNIFFRERTSPSAKGSILFVHGNSVNSKIWEKQFTSEVLKEYNLYAIDLPGHGQSSLVVDPTNEYSLIGYAKTLSEFVKAISLRNFIIVGFSLGGHLSTEALLDIQGCKGIVLSGTPSSNYPLDISKMFLPNPFANLAFKAILSDDEIKNFVTAAFKPHSNLDIHPIVEMVKQTDPMAREYLAAGIATGKMKNEVDILNTINFPPCYIHGEEEQLVNIDYLNILSVPKWGDVIHKIPDSGHLCFYENAEVFNDIINEYCEEMMSHSSMELEKMRE